MLAPRGETAGSEGRRDEGSEPLSGGGGGGVLLLLKADLALTSPKFGGCAAEWVEVGV